MSKSNDDDNTNVMASGHNDAKTSDQQLPTQQSYTSSGQDQKTTIKSNDNKSSSVPNIENNSQTSTVDQHSHNNVITSAPSINDAIEAVKKGEYFYKVRGTNRFYWRKYHLDYDSMRLHYIGGKKHFPCMPNPFIDLLGAIEVRSGWSTDRFKKFEAIIRKNFSKKIPPIVPESQCFSIVFEEKAKSIDLVATSPEIRNTWCLALDYIIKQVINISSQNQSDGKSEIHLFLKKLFDLVDEGKVKYLTVKQVKDIFSRLSISRDVTSNLFSHRTRGDKYTFEQFIGLFDSIYKRPDLVDIFIRHTSDGKSMTVNELITFMVETQDQGDFNIDSAIKLIKQFDNDELTGSLPNDPIEDKEENNITPAELSLSLDTFTKFMTSRELNSLRHSSSEISHDMNQPLSHYFIATSHNTYLLWDQLVGASSCDAYSRALTSGCRCIELDVWDGSDGEPIIYHGHTLTSTILLRDVVETIAKYAFKTSKYPVILSIENHLSKDQEIKMAEYFSFILGDLLLDQPVENHEDKWPSPEMLMNKIIIKAKKATELYRSDEEGNDDSSGSSDQEDDKPIGREKKSKTSKTSTKSASSKVGEAVTVKDSVKNRSSLITTPSKNVPNTSKKPDDESAAGSSTQASKLNTQQLLDELRQKTQKARDDFFTDLDEVLTSEVSIDPFEEPDKLKFPKKDYKSSTDDNLIKEGADACTECPIVPKDKESGDTSDDQQIVLVEAEAISLSDVVIYCVPRHFKSFDECSSWKFYEMSSFSETKAAKLISEDSKAFVSYNRDHLSRIYPRGSRLDSSNMDPTLYWSVGCQLVALNYQTNDRAVRTNRSLFRGNSSTGYLLKPIHLRGQRMYGANSDFHRELLGRCSSVPGSPVQSPTSPQFSPLSKDSFNLVIKVISGQFLPKVTSEGISYSPGEAIDPYVKITMYGHPNKKKKFQTSHVNNNGLNPIWKEEEFMFTIDAPDLAFIEFKVKDSALSQQNTTVGYYILPVNQIRCGYRYIELEDASGKSLFPASLFVHISKKPYN